MPNEYPNVYSNYVNRLEEKMTFELNRIEETLLASSDNGILLRAKYELYERIRQMKSDPDYINQIASNDNTPPTSAPLDRGAD